MSPTRETGFFGVSGMSSGWILARADQNQDTARRLKQGLDGFLTKPQDRMLFDLLPKAATE